MRLSFIAPILLLLCLPACTPSLQLTLHDEDAAALISSNFLHTAFYEHKFREAYDSTDAQFKAGADRTNFVVGIEKLQTTLSPTNFIILDYSTWGSTETIGIYGSAQTSSSNVLYFRCLLTGTLIRGYGLTRVDFSTQVPPKTGVNAPFKNPIKL